MSHLSVSEIEVDGLGVSDVEDSVRLGREARAHSAAALSHVLLEQRHRAGRHHIPVRLVVLA